MYKESFSELTGRLNNIRQYVETSELIKQKMLELNPKWKQKPKVLVQASHNGNLWWGVGAPNNGMPWAGHDAKNESAITLIWYNDPKHDSDKENSDSDDAAYISIPTLNLIKPVNGFPNFEFKSAGLYADDSVYIRPIKYDVGYINDGWQNWDATVAMSRLYNKSIGYKSKVDVFVEDKETGDKWQYKANAEDVFSSGKYPTILWTYPHMG